MKLFQSPIFWVGIVVAVSVGIIVAGRLWRRDPPAPSAERPSVVPQEEAGFRDVVKNPELWRQMINEQQDVEREAEAARGWSDERVAEAVRWYVLELKSSRRAWDKLTVLQKLAARTRPEALRILRDSSLRPRLVEATREDEHSLPEAPFNRLCKLLDKPPPEVAPLLMPFTEDPLPEIRRDAARLLGEIGTEEALTALQKALGDSDEYVRSWALRGLNAALKENRIGAEGRRGLFDSGLRLLGEGKNADEAASLLLKIDRERAVAFFLSDASMSPQSKALHRVLELLNEERISVPRERLLAIVHELKKPHLDYPQTYQLHEVLRALGRHKVPEDRGVLNGYLSHADERVAEGAAAGLLASHELEDFRQRIGGPRGGKGLTVPQRHYRAVSWLDDEVSNGGFSQYFFNSSGDNWRDALAALEAMGSKERLAIFREVLAKFGAAGPSEDREKRMGQLSKIANAEDALFDRFDSRYYKSTEVIDVMVMRYVLKNPDAFR
jgi:HEAT repeat protein